MHAFLVCVRDVLRDEKLILHYSGTQCAGTFLALVLAVCPEDVRVEVDGEMGLCGCRDSITFSVTHELDAVPRFNIERRLKAHTDDFSRTHIDEGRHELDPQLNFSWDGMLSSQYSVHKHHPDPAHSHILPV